MSFFAALILTIFSADTVNAEIYKYIDKKGDVVYTDSLSALPAARRAYYVKKKREREQKREAMERRVGKEELDRREAEKKLKALNKKKLSKRQYAAQKAALDARLRDFDQRRKQRQDKIQAWQGKMDKLKANLNQKITELKKLREEANQAAFRYSSTAMLVHAQTREKCLKRLNVLEKEIDQLTHQIEIELPAKARKAGVRVR